ncbi:MAG: single-stranded DNA-binding protein [Negativicutes bacterium]
MNRVIIAGTLTGEPQQVTTKTGRFRYGFSLKVNDGNGGNPEIMEVVGMSECIKVLKQAALRGQQVLVYGSIHTCEGTDPEVPGKHRFVRADDIAPLKLL